MTENSVAVSGLFARTSRNSGANLYVTVTNACRFNETSQIHGAGLHHFESRWLADDPSEPLVLDADTRVSHVTWLGLVEINRQDKRRIKEGVANRAGGFRLSPLGRKQEHVKNRASILIVDDDPMVREAIKLLLEHCGHEVEQASSGEAALARLAQRAFDVVITDFSMPGMHGDQLVARIRERLPAQRVIMASGFVEEYQVFGQPAAQVDALLLKPFSFQELQDTLERVFAVGPPDASSVLPPREEPTPESDFRPPPEP